MCSRTFIKENFKENFKENYYDHNSPNKNLGSQQDIVEGYGGRFQGCAFSTGDYNTVGNPALCQKDLSIKMAGNPMNSMMTPSRTMEGYCKSCRSAPKRAIMSYGQEMRKGGIKEAYCRGCNSGKDYNLFNYDMIEKYEGCKPASYIPTSLSSSGILGNMDFPPPAVMIPHKFVNNMKLSIEDPDNMWTYWLGGVPNPCGSGPNQPAQKRTWLGVSD